MSWLHRQVVLRVAHRPVATTATSNGRWHDYGPWSDPYSVVDHGLVSHVLWIERRCRIDGCHAGQWERLNRFPWEKQP